MKYMVKPSRTENKLVIVMRKDLNMPVGKCIAQGGHAILGVVNLIRNEGTPEQKQSMADWDAGSFTKITLAVDSEEKLLKIYEKAQEQGLPVRLIRDNGWTVFDGIPTLTCLGILGKSSEIDKVTKRLRLY